MNIIIVGGNGKLGKSIFNKLINEKYKAICVDITSKIKTLQDLDKQTQIDAIIDVSTSKNSINTTKYALDNNIPLIIGCTNHTQEELEIINKAAIKIPVFLAYNFSIALQYFYECINILSKINSSIYISETHHNNKKDKPSGTAKEIKKIINNNHKEISDIFSLRGGNILGSHLVNFICDNEQIKISHEVFNREVFANGALNALNFIVKQQNGLYSMKDLIKNAF